MDFDKLFSDVLNLDPSIRYAAIQNNAGKIITGGFRENVVPILNDEDIQMMHYYASQRWQTRKNIEHKIGPAKYALAEYDKIKRISFPIDEKHLLMVTTEINSDHTNIIARVLELINNSKS
ncbi:DUF6659 family protein [Candidatus Nitrosopumilus sediminis]|uniref:Roadblock/LAMTOR2 domain-containing protein n=1 Tax=Candidatus Nitrosopumilus sediminis TaxID=1229909 RepID=K0BD04_9ARCH|nr:DUF6659 family protein [Candidatus Nitrosopumilus sediminis]AFS82256.1 hypothetical protein NSED_02230 [Candidatus Nitrosopumilus sediminis]